MFASTVVPNIALRWMAVQAILAVVIFVSLLIGLKGINSFAALVEHVDLLTFYPVSILAGLHVRNWIERMHRRNYLMSLRDELRLADLARWKARADATLANMSQGIVMREGSGHVPVINRRAVELLGLPEHFLEGSAARGGHRCAISAKRGIRRSVTAGGVRERLQGRHGRGRTPALREDAA